MQNKEEEHQREGIWLLELLLKRHLYVAHVVETHHYGPHEVSYFGQVIQPKLFISV